MRCGLRVVRARSLLMSYLLYGFCPSVTFYRGSDYSGRVADGVIKFHVSGEVKWESVECSHVTPRSRPIPVAQCLHVAPSASSLWARILTLSSSWVRQSIGVCSGILLNLICTGTTLF